MHGRRGAGPPSRANLWRRAAPSPGSKGIRGGVREACGLGLAYNALMRRSSILWLVVILGAGGAVALRVGRQAIVERLMGPGAESRPVDGALPPPRDYLVEPVVHPFERPRRIVSLAPSITETCCALGLLDRLVGRTQYCVHPPAVRAVPVVGALVDPNLELILSIQPDIILISKNASRVRDQLASLGLPFEEVTDDTLAGLFEGIETIGRLTGRPRTAGVLIENLQRDLEAIARAGRTRRPRRVLIVLGELPVPPQSVFVAGPELFLSELLVRLGHTNAAAGLVRGKSGELSLEQIVAINPDVILETAPGNGGRSGEEVYAAWARVGPIRAIRDRAVRVYGTADDLVPSPRINVVFHRLAAALAEWR